jgi:hypothetical protein
MPMIRDDEEDKQLEMPDVPPPLEEKPRTAYECKGVNVIVHYVKQYMP